MDGRRGTRRRFLGALIGGVAILGAGRISGARAEPTKAPDLTPGQLKSDCDSHDGTYIESKKDNVSACFWSDKSKTVCDYDGTDCYNYPPPPKPTNVVGGNDPFGGFGWEATTDVGFAENPDTATTPAQGITAPPADDNVERAVKSGKRRRRGKRRKK